MPKRAAVAAMIRGIVSNLVDDPASVVVEEIVQDTSITFRIRCSPEDSGKIIGKQGRTARSLRDILLAASNGGGYRFFLDIVTAQPAAA